MKALAISCLIPVLTAGLILAAPATATARDRHCYRGSHQGHHRHHGHHGHHYRSSSRAVFLGSPSYSRGYYSPYYSRYSHYPGSYFSTGYSSGYYAPSASIGLSLYSSPSYGYRSSRYYPSNYYRSSRPSYSNDLAVDVQRALRRSGYYYGDIDGDIGPQSRGAIREYQRDRGLPATGRIDSSLLRSLRIG